MFFLRKGHIRLTDKRIRRNEKLQAIEDHNSVRLLKPWGINAEFRLIMADLCSIQLRRVNNYTLLTPQNATPFVLYCNLE